MGLIDIIGGLFLTKYSYDIRKPKSVTESVSYKSYARQYHKELASMDLWDGIEAQVKKHLNFYDKNSCEWYEACVYWKGDKNKICRINMITVNINKEYYASGLSMDEFAKKYFTELKQKYKSNNQFWKNNFTESYRNIQLYDINGNAHYFSHFSY